MATKTKQEEKKVQGRKSMGGTKKDEVKNTGTRPTRRLQSARDPFWYMKETDELAKVNDKDTNLELGINKIHVFTPSEKQEEYMAVANVRLETVIGMITGITVKQSDRDGGLFVQTGSKNIGSKDEPKWINEVRLERPVQAQVLRFIETLLVDGDEE